MKNITQAVILAGGTGTRLRPFTLTNPKPMFPIYKRPILEYLIEMLKENGIKEVVILIGYLGEKIQQHFRDGSKYGLKITYSFTPLLDEEGNENESGIRIKNAEDLLEDNFLLMYCDNFWPMNLLKMTKAYWTMNTLAMVTAYNNKDGFGEYGYKNNLKVSNNNLVLEYDSTRQRQGLNALDIGFFILNKKVLEFLPNKSTHLGRDILPKLVAKKQLSAYRTDHRYYFATSLLTMQKLSKFLKPKKVVFLDRDGIINKKIEGDYVRNWSQFEFLPGAIQALMLLSKNDYQIYIITNQRGVGRSLMSLSDLENIHRRMLRELKKHKVKIDKIYYCPHNENECECRKPKPGLLFKAANENYLDLPRVIFIGDSQKDIEAGDAAGCKTILINNKREFLQVINSLVKN